jgi:hypothetical protein
MMGVALLVLSRFLVAQEQAVSKPLRFDFTPFFGYRTSISFPIEPHISGTNPSMVIDASPSYGIAFGLRVHEDDLVEVRWVRQDSYIHSNDPAVAFARQRVVLDQFHGDFSHEYTLEEWRPWIRPFVMASVGATHTSAGAGVDFTRFSFGIGGGIRFYPSRHLGFKIQAEWLPVFADPQVAFVCGAGCIFHVGGTLASQGEVFVGPLFRF